MDHKMSDLKTLNQNVCGGVVALVGDGVDGPMVGRAIKLIVMNFLTFNT